jgi:hypothetical protein
MRGTDETVGVKLAEKKEMSLFFFENESLINIWIK